MASGEQNITALPVKTNTGVANSDYFMGIDSAEGYQILIRDLAKYIMENYNGSTLAGQAQTPKAAIDALNSRLDNINSAGSVAESATILAGLTSVYNSVTASQTTLQIGFFTISNVGRFVALIHKNSANYGSAIAFGYGVPTKLYKINCQNGAMSDLYELNFTSAS